MQSCPQLLPHSMRIKPGTIDHRNRDVLDVLNQALIRVQTRPTIKTLLVSMSFVRILRTCDRTLHERELASLTFCAQPLTTAIVREIASSNIVFLATRLPSLVYRTAGRGAAPIARASSSPAAQRRSLALIASGLNRRVSAQLSSQNWAVDANQMRSLSDPLLL